MVGSSAVVVPNGVVSAEGPQINTEAMRSLLGNTISRVHSLSSTSSIPGQARLVLATDVNKFFNAVVQCLAQTPFLLTTLKELSKPKLVLL